MHASGTGPLYSNAEMYNGSEADLGPSNEYNIDLAPKVSHAPEVEFTLCWFTCLLLSGHTSGNFAGTLDY